MDAAKQLRVVRIVRAVDQQLETALTMLLAIIIAATASSLITFKTANEFSISNVSNIQYGWGPETNYARVLFIIAAATVLFFGLQAVKRRVSVRWFRFLVALFAATSFFISLAALMPAAPSVDMFHTGEQLSPALDYTKGKQLYSDLFFLHGAGEDILLPALAFKLFGTSIGAYALFESVASFVSVLLFFLLIGLLIRPGGLFLFVVFWFMGTTYGGAEYTKNIPVFIVLGLAWLVWHRLINNRRIYYLAVGGIGFLASLSLLLAIDVAVIMLLFCGLFGLALLLFEAHDTGKLRLNFQRLKQRVNYTAPLALLSGIGIAQGIMLTLLRPSDYAEFIRMTVFEIPKYQGLMFDYPMPFITTETYPFWLPIFLAVLTAIMLVQLACPGLKKNLTMSKDTAFAGLLFAFSLLYMRFGVGRPDAPHIEISVGIFFVTSFYIIQLFIRSMLHDRKTLAQPWIVIMFIGVLFWPNPTWNPPKLFNAANRKPSDVAQIANLPDKPDTAWLNQEQRQVVAFIKANTTPKDAIYVYEPEPLYYYLTGRSNPSRFYISWFADPQQYTTELLNDLKATPPKYIIYSGPPTTEISDGIPIRDRTPEVEQWIVKNYPKRTTIEHTVILGK